MFERFTKASRRVVTRSASLAQELDSTAMGPEHMLLAIVGEDSVLGDQGYSSERMRDQIVSTGPVDDDAEALKAVGIDLEAVRAAVVENFGDQAWTDADTPRKRRRLRQPMNSAARKALELSLKEAVRRRDRSIRIEHLILGITCEPTPLVTSLIADRMPIGQLRELVRHSLDSAA